MAQHRDPNFRPRQGVTRKDIVLSPEAERAYGIWRGIYAERCEQARGEEVKPRVRHDLLNNLIATEGNTIGGQLISIAATDARAREICEDTMMAALREEWATVQLLAEAAKRLDPPAPIATQADTCRHGVLYADTCTACDNEMGE